MSSAKTRLLWFQKNCHVLMSSSEPRNVVFFVSLNCISCTIVFLECGWKVLFKVYKNRCCNGKETTN